VGCYVNFGERNGNVQQHFIVTRRRGKTEAEGKPIDLRQR
jgi:hypothetical protein